MADPDTNLPFVLAGAFAILCLLLLALAALWGRIWAWRATAAGDAVVRAMPCTICRRDLEIRRDDFVAMSRTEMGLVVSVKPSIVGRPLAEYRCPGCDASHTFAMDVHPPQWILANAYESQDLSSNCVQCGKHLLRPSWPKGQYNGRVRENPDLDPSHGLVCSRCKAVCCYRCVADATRNRTKDGSTLCPRCFRGPVEEYFVF